MDAGQLPDTGQFMKTLEMMSMFETYFTQEQRDAMSQRRARLGDEAIEAMKAEWLQLAQQLSQHQTEGVPVDDPRVQALTSRWDEIGSAFHGGDPGITAAAGRMWQENRAELSDRLPPAANAIPSIVDYVRRAREAR